jgi:hypothetical protein
MGLVLMAAIVTWPPFARCAETLDQEASRLYEKHRARMTGIKTVRLEYRLSIEQSSLAVERDPAPLTRVVWDRGRKKIKNKTLGTEVKSYVADAGAGTLDYSEGTATVYRDELDRNNADTLSTPYPGWLWRPEWLLPLKPSGAREEPGAVVLVMGSAHPRREIWLNRSSGVLFRFVDTDATGQVVRIVNLTEWTSVGNVLIPRFVDEEVRTATGIIRRKLAINASGVNEALKEADFALP